VLDGHHQKVAVVVGVQIQHHGDRALPQEHQVLSILMASELLANKTRIVLSWRLGRSDKS
jgi:hypothetical protein